MTLSARGPRSVPRARVLRPTGFRALSCILWAGSLRSALSQLPRQPDSSVVSAKTVSLCRIRKAEERWKAFFPELQPPAGHCKPQLLLGPEDATPGVCWVPLAGSLASGWKQQLRDSAGSWWSSPSFPSPNLPYGFDAPKSPFKGPWPSNMARGFPRWGSAGTDTRNPHFLFLQKPKLKEVKGQLEGHRVLSGKSVTRQPFLTP